MQDSYYHLQSNLYPLACEYVPAAWPVSVPPVMRRSHPHAPLSVIAPSTVPEYTPSYDVQCELVRSVHPPVE